MRMVKEVLNAMVASVKPACKSINGGGAQCAGISAGGARCRPGHCLADAAAGTPATLPLPHKSRLRTPKSLDP